MSNTVKINKEELRYVALALSAWDHFMVGDRGIQMKDLPEAIRPLDSALANKVRAWNSLRQDITEYVKSRIEKQVRP
jgi:hypothetical protein